MPRPRRLPFEVRIVWPGAGLGGGIPMAHVGAFPVARRRRETGRIMQRREAEAGDAASGHDQQG